MKPALVLAAMLAMVGLHAACGGDAAVPATPTRIPPNATPMPPPPTPIPTPLRDSVRTLSDAELTALVPASESIESTFPDLRLDTRESGPVGNAAAAEESPIVGESSETLAAQGRLGGYSSNFRSLLALFDPKRQEASPFLVSSAVDLFNTSESAGTYLDRWVDALHNWIGVDLDGIVLENITETEPPQLGGKALKARADAVVVGYEIDFGGTLIAWTQGRTFAVLVVLGAGGRDWADAAEAAAREMDAIIQSSAVLR